MTASAQTEYPELALKLGLITRDVCRLLEYAGSIEESLDELMSEHRPDLHGRELDAYLDGFWQRLDEISPQKREGGDDAA